MSGIAGIYYLDGRPVDTEVDRMVDVMKHRGPDEQATWSDGTIGLGHCMLHTTPESLHASLPQEGAQSGCVVTADARIDNREDLIQNLRLSSGRDQVVPDSTLILHAYEKWGRDCVDHLLGAFAFVIWDPREEHLFCALDHFGVRPFYYYHEPGKLFAFASEIKSLFVLENIPKTLNETRVAQHLVAQVEGDVTRTYFEHIHRVSPAHTLTVRTGSAVKTRYWALDPSREVQFSSDEQYAERFKSLFEKAVQARLRSNGPIGSMLSGGLDSSSIVCQATQLLEGSVQGAALHTFSAVFDEDSGSDESQYINEVLEKCEELQPHFIQGDEKSPIAEWDELQKYVDGACTAGNAYIFWRSLRRASDQGIRVMLDGFDGDTTLSHGMGYLRQLRAERRLLKLAIGARARAKQTGESEWDVMWAWLKEPVLELPGLSQLASFYRALKSSFDGRTKTESGGAAGLPRWRRVLSDELADSIEPYVRREEHSTPETDHEHHAQLLNRPLMKRIPDLWSQMAGAHSINFRYPFYDKRLVEYCLSLPARQKLRHGWSRVVLRQAMEGVLPPEVQWRKRKGDLSMALDTCLATFEKPLLRRLGEGEIGEIGRYVSIDFLRRHVPEYLNGNIGSGGGGGSSKNGTVVWRALSLALWLRHLDSQ